MNDPMLMVASSMVVAVSAALVVANTVLAPLVCENVMMLVACALPSVSAKAVAASSDFIGFPLQLTDEYAPLAWLSPFVVVVMASHSWLRSRHAAFHE